MDITITTLLILALATFRITHLFVYDEIFEFIRKPFFIEEEVSDKVYLVPKNFIGQLLNCYWCTGFWVSLFIWGFYALFPSITLSLSLLFAVAGLAAIIHRWVVGRDEE